VRIAAAIDQAVGFVAKRFVGWCGTAALGCEIQSSSLRYREIVVPDFAAGDLPYNALGYDEPPKRFVEGSSAA
jgi:hypothetical protein